AQITICSNPSRRQHETTPSTHHCPTPAALDHPSQQLSSRTTAAAEHPPPSPSSTLLRRSRSPSAHPQRRPDVASPSMLSPRAAPSLLGFAPPTIMLSSLSSFVRAPPTSPFCTSSARMNHLLVVLESWA
uniref:Uncharacterized protein n=1 Tax=Triticum urartu TaxID=4572 RepID=A0A8R7VJE2_TRIUA